MRIAYLNGICVEHDAISKAIRDEVTWLRESGHDVKLLCYKCDYEDVPHRVVNDVGEVVFDPFFQSCELAIFHFGIFSPLFDALPVTPVGAGRIVVFHNVTPRELVPQQGQELIDKSMRQIGNMTWADHVLCDSQTNLDVLRAQGISTPNSVMPLAVSTDLQPPMRKPSSDDGVVRIAFIGRFVRAKGPLELLSALVDVAASPSAPRIHLDLIGNIAFSDQALVAELRDEVARIGARHAGRLTVDLHGNASGEKKHEVLTFADIFALPTYHEGFCVPVIEALSSGCRVITYDNSNLPSICGGLGTLVETGNKRALADALSQVLGEVSSKQWIEVGYAEFAERARRYVDAFDPSVIRRKFTAFIDDFVVKKSSVRES